jgi:Zn-dependent M28 family amino/carboxypeptidase
MDIARTLCVLVILGILASCSPEKVNNNSQFTEKVDFLFEPLLTIDALKTLSADEMAGRRTGTDGNAKARAYIINRLKALDTGPLNGRYEHSFDFLNNASDEDETPMTGVNILATISGSKPENDRKLIVISAHYDHVGVRSGKIYNGADDNASGVVGLLAVIEAFQHKPPANDIVFAFLDAEEMGLHGARALVKEYETQSMKADFNINFDMLSRSDKNELYAAGAYHTPNLKPVITSLIPLVPVTLLMGHDDPSLGVDDWTLQSDHGPFHQAGIPFLYFGVEDHPYYHQPTDDFDTIPQDFFLRSVQTVIMASYEIDQSLNMIVSAR